MKICTVHEEDSASDLRCSRERLDFLHHLLMYHGHGDPRCSSLTPRGPRSSARHLWQSVAAVAAVYTLDRLLHPQQTSAPQSSHGPSEATRSHVKHWPRLLHSSSIASTSCPSSLKNFCSASVVPREQREPRLPRSSTCRCVSSSCRCFSFSFLLEL